MADFTPDQLRAGQRTPDARVNVVVDPNNLLAIGEHAASLAVVDAEGNASPAVTIRIQVVDADRPTAAIRVFLDNQELRPVNGVFRIPFGARFVLDGSESTDPTSPIREYRWQLRS